jgi:hypothetical protein
MGKFGKQKDGEIVREDFTVKGYTHIHIPKGTYTDDTKESDVSDFTIGETHREGTDG